MTNKRKSGYVIKDLAYFTRECSKCSTTEILNRCSELMVEYCNTKDNRILENPELYYKLIVVTKRWLIKDYQNIAEDVMEDISHNIAAELVMKLKRKGLVIENLMAYLRILLRNITINHIRSLYTTRDSTGKAYSLDEYLGGSVEDEHNFMEPGSYVPHSHGYTRTEKEIMYSLSLSKVLKFMSESLKENLITRKYHWKYLWIVVSSFVEGNFILVNNIKNTRTRIFLKIVITNSYYEYLKLIK